MIAIALFYLDEKYREDNMNLGIRWAWIRTYSYNIPVILRELGNHYLTSHVLICKTELIFCIL